MACWSNCFGQRGFFAAYQANPGVGQALLFGVGVLLWEGALINLYPFNFLEMDGYNIVADLLAMPTLRQQALALAPQLHRRVFQPRTLTKAEWIQIAYLLLCAVSVLIYLIAHLDFLRLATGLEVNQEQHLLVKRSLTTKARRARSSEQLVLRILRVLRAFVVNNRGQSTANSDQRGITSRR
jgi:hypothetical protein